MNTQYDAIIVGGGHAGCEAAMALARLDFKTLLITTNVDRIGHMSCNPAVGGLGKSHIVREIDALGGMMGLWADASGIQFRTLNTGKGPAVRATRAQSDRKRYMQAAQNTVFHQPNLTIWQDQVVEILHTDRVTGVRTQIGLEFSAPHAILTTGTFLSGIMHIGLTQIPGGRLGDAPAIGLSDSLRDIGVPIGRLKTGTTPRLLASSIDFDRIEVQPGDTPLPCFSFWGPQPTLPQRPCYITWTNEQTHEVIRGGLDRSPMFTGVIKSAGARYCPSVEDKVFRFPDRDHHHVFLEPEGLDSPECYPNGLSTSLPIDVQMAMLRTIVGLEHVKLVRPGYAIEYDYADTTTLHPTLESKLLPGLWFAGQINGTSGYEEAAGQGLWAGINVACQLGGLDPWLPGRDEAYMAVLVDDLVTKGTKEPYRMFTSRAEHRLLLRESNADTRLTRQGRDLGLVGNEQWAVFTAKHAFMNRLHTLLEKLRIPADASVNDRMARLGEPPLQKGPSLAELLRRPAIHLRDLPMLIQRGQTLKEEEQEVLTLIAGHLSAPCHTGSLGQNETRLTSRTIADATTEVELRIKYAGYLARQETLVKRSAQQEHLVLPEDLDYNEVAGLSHEIRQKLTAARPRTLGQAGRISGVTPAALVCLQIFLHKQKLGKKARGA